MKHKNIIQKFIEQVLLETLSPEADENDIFGKWFAPGERSLPHPEENTDSEWDAISALQQFMGASNNSKELDANNGYIPKQFLTLLQQHKYSNYQGGLKAVAQVAGNNFFGKPGEIGKIGGYPDEMETISVGPVTITNGIFCFGSYLNIREIHAIFESVGISWKL